MPPRAPSHTEVKNPWASPRRPYVSKKTRLQRMPWPSSGAGLSPVSVPFPLASAIPAHRGPPASEEPGPAVLQNPPQTEFFFCEPHKEGRREGRPGHKDARPGGRLGWTPVSAGPSLVQLEPHPFGSRTFGGSQLPPPLQPDPEPGRTWLLPLTSLASRLTARGTTPPSKCTRTPAPLHAFPAFPFTSAC